MRISTKLSAAFGLYVAILAALLIYHTRTNRMALSTSYELSEVAPRVYLGAMELRDLVAQLDENATKYRVTHDAGYFRKFERARDTFALALNALDTLSLSDRERVELVRLAAGWQEFKPLAARLPRLLGNGASREARISLARLQMALDTLHAGALRLSDASRDAMVERLRRSVVAGQGAEHLSWGAVAMVLLLSVVVSGLIVRSITESLDRWKGAIHQVARGNFSYQMEAARNDEFADVAQDFNAMARRLGELDRMKQDFVSAVSHDLKTPLASMRETTGALLDEVPGPLAPAQRRLLELSQESGRRLSAMIAKLLDLSHLESGSFRLEFERRDLGDLVRQASAQMEPVARERGVRLASALSDQPVPVACDGDYLMQVFDNLLENAVKFSPEGAEVRIAARVCSHAGEEIPAARWRLLRGSGPAALVTVADRGPGVPDAEKGQIFERFFQTADGRKVRGRGVGLGLTICREIVAAHGGTIWAADNPGGGAAFRILLPAAAG